MNVDLPAFGAANPAVDSFSDLPAPRFSMMEERVVKLRLRENESIQDAVRRFRKRVDDSGIKNEMRRHEFYEKPSDIRRRTRRRAERRARLSRLSANQRPG